MEKKLDPAELLSLMVRKNISDIHFKADSRPLIRVNGRLKFIEGDPLSAEQIEQIIDSLLTPEQKKILESERELDFAYSVSNIARFRVNAYYQRGSAALALRVVPLKILNFADLNLPVDTLEKLASESRGLILISGITGAGKTTTLNAIIDYINNNFSYNIVMVEDPIEYYHQDVKSAISQREVGGDTHSFARALHYVLRQDPDVVVIGEMRDFESISAGITAAETGHLVLSTIHTIDAVQTIDRIIDMYPVHQQNTVRQQLANILKGIVSQRLLVCNDGNSRVPVTEILLGTGIVRKIIAEGKIIELYKAMEQGAYYGMHTFDQDILRIYREGKISIEEALDKATNPDDLNLQLRGISREQ